MNQLITQPTAQPGLWREAGSPHDLVRLDLEAFTPGMVVVARVSEDWQRKPALRWQTWPEDLQPVGLHRRDASVRLDRKSFHSHDGEGASK